jgi:hypothetical protein
MGRSALFLAGEVVVVMVVVVVVVVVEEEEEEEEEEFWRWRIESTLFPYSLQRS